MAVTKAQKNRVNVNASRNLKKYNKGQ